jgi:hypothetical protein
MMNGTVPNRWPPWNHLLLLLSEVLTCWAVGALILRDAFGGAAIGVIDAVAGTAFLLGGACLGASAFGTDRQRRTRTIWAAWFLGGGFVVYAGHLF